MPRAWNDNWTFKTWTQQRGRVYRWYAKALLALALAFSCAGPAHAASGDDIDKLSTYAVLLGRGIACGADGTEEASRKIGAWMDRRFTKKEMATYIQVFAVGVEHNAKMQQAGKSPDSCSTVQRNFSSIPWP